MAVDPKYLLPFQTNSSKLVPKLVFFGWAYVAVSWQHPVQLIIALQLPKFHLIFRLSIQAQTRPTWQPRLRTLVNYSWPHCSRIICLYLLVLPILCVMEFQFVVPTFFYKLYLAWGCYSPIVVSTGLMVVLELFKHWVHLCRFGLVDLCFRDQESHQDVCGGMCERLSCRNWIENEPQASTSRISRIQSK